jgi:hypothetical protein
MGTCSDFKGLFSRRYKEIGISDSDIQPHSSSRDKETGNKNVITEESAAGAHRSFISRAYIEVPIALSAGNLPDFGRHTRAGTALTNQKRQWPLHQLSPREFIFLCFEVAVENLDSTRNSFICNNPSIADVTYPMQRL